MMRDSQKANPVYAARRRYTVQFEMHHARHTSGQWLHISGTKLTNKLAYAWCGYEHQFEALKSKHGLSPQLSTLLRQCDLIAVKNARELQDLSFTSQKENLEEFFNA